MALLTLTLRLSANIGEEPFNLRTDVYVERGTTGEVCIVIEGPGGLDGTAWNARSCWIAEQQYIRLQRVYRLIPFGEYTVRLEHRTKIVVPPQSLIIRCSERVNRTNQPRCSD